VDVTDYGEVVNALAGADAVIHMAAIAAPNHMPEHQLFRINMLSNWNVLEACEVHGIRKVVMASSINALGAGWGHNKYAPLYFPVDEAHPTRVEDAYSQSKWLGEQMAEAFVRRRGATMSPPGPSSASGTVPGGGVQIANMRFHALWDPATALRHREQGDKQSVGGRTGMGFWSWVGRHDAARACRLAVEKDFGGAEAFFINASDTVLDIPTEEAVKREYPGVPIRKPLPGFASALDISKAKRLLGWEPVESWRDGTVRAPEPVKGARPPAYEAPWMR
jgi:nucleoside-diphosphate-sugar epimerase